MDIGEFRQQFIDELRFNAEHEGTEPEYQFINRALNDLEELGELNDPMPMSVEIRGRRGRIMSFDAYAYDEADSSLILISSVFSNERDAVSTLTNSKIDETYLRMRNFIDECVNGNISEYCDAANPAINVGKEFKKRIGKGIINTEILRFKFYILTDSIRSKQVKNISKEAFLDRPVNLDIWDIERFFHTFSSNSSEVIDLNTAEFGCEGIPCIKAELGNNSEYDAYLGIIPGRFLADIYLQYGSKLLQRNIRAFLGVRNSKANINNGIRNTIMNHPSNFFTYNNGVAIVARSVCFSADGTKIVRFIDPQIINGGQTTASLANAVVKKEDKNGMDTLFVPMKLTVLNVEDDMSEDQIEQYNEITKKISECANSQNAVSGADFFSNHPFHVMMEKLSHKVMAPPVSGNPYQTIWFYERSRGQWEQEQMKLTPAQRKTFIEKNPKNQVIKKEKLAKCLNTIYMRPHEVCQSSAINFKKFADVIEQLYDASRESINDEFYKKCVCSVIIFDQLDTLVNKSDWYPKGGNKAQIIPYAIAKLMSLIPRDRDLDWKVIWQKQSMYPALAEELMRLAYCAHNFLMEEAKGGIVRSISRNQSVWTNFKAYRYTLTDRFLTSLISKEETRIEESSAKREHKFNANIEASVEIFKLGADYWMKVYRDLSKEQILPYGELDLIKNVAGCISRGILPTDAQCKRLIKAVTKAENKGYLML